MISGHASAASTHHMKQADFRMYYIPS